MGRKVGAVAMINLSLHIDDERGAVKTVVDEDGDLRVECSERWGNETSEHVNVFIGWQRAAELHDQLGKALEARKVTA